MTRLRILEALRALLGGLLLAGGFIALLWPRLRGRLPIVVAIVGAGLALALVPFAPAGVPILASSLVAAVAGLLSRESR